jgi:hypothetical protein
MHGWPRELRSATGGIKNTIFRDICRDYSETFWNLESQKTSIKKEEE